MSGAAMAPAERYGVLAHAATRPGADLAEPRAAAGAVLLALRDLGGLSCLAPDAGGRLHPLGGAEGRAHASSLLMATFDRSLTEAGWVDRLCLSPMCGRLRRALGELSSSVSGKTGVPLVRRRGISGLVSGARELDRSHPSFPPAAWECLGWLAGPGEAPAAALRMLDLAGALRPLSRLDAAAVRRALEAHRGSSGWHSCDEVVSLVENAGFMGATLTGAL